jgi:hypothetical protein
MELGKLGMTQLRAALGAIQLFQRLLRWLEEFGFPKFPQAQVLHVGYHSTGPRIAGVEMQIMNWAAMVDIQVQFQ